MAKYEVKVQVELRLDGTYEIEAESEDDAVEEAVRRATEDDYTDESVWLWPMVDHNDVELFDVREIGDEPAQTKAARS